MPPPRKRFGQNFLTDRHALERIVTALELNGTERVVEIGPGRGALTDLLVRQAREVVAVEIDRDLTRVLRTRYAAVPSVTIVEGDVLDLDLAALGGEGYSLVGNVPYYVTTPIIFHALAFPRPRVAVFLVQREVAERLVAAPGSSAFGALTANVQSLAAVEVVGHVGAGAFFPKPKVESTIVRFRPLAAPLVAPAEERAISQFIVGLFGQRRRQLLRAVRTVTGHGAEQVARLLARVELDASVRAETLAPARLVHLARAALADEA